MEKTITVKNVFLINAHHKDPHNHTSMLLSALSHSFCPGPELEQRLRSELMASVTARAAAANWFITLGALGSAERALAANSSFEEETEIVLR